MLPNLAVPIVQAQLGATRRLFNSAVCKNRKIHPVAPRQKKDLKAGCDYERSNEPSGCKRYLQVVSCHTIEWRNCHILSRILQSLGNLIPSGMSSNQTNFFQLKSWHGIIITAISTYTSSKPQACCFQYNLMRNEQHLTSWPTI